MGAANQVFFLFFFKAAVVCRQEAQRRRKETNSSTSKRGTLLLWPLFFVGLRFLSFFLSLFIITNTLFFYITPSKICCTHIHRFFLLCFFSFPPSFPIHYHISSYSSLSPFSSDPPFISGEGWVEDIGPLSRVSFGFGWTTWARSTSQETDKTRLHRHTKSGRNRPAGVCVCLSVWIMRYAQLLVPFPLGFLSQHITQFLPLTSFWIHLSHLDTHF